MEPKTNIGNEENEEKSKTIKDPIPEKKRSALQMLPLALAGDPAQYHTGTHWRYRGVSRYPGDLIWPLCAVC